MKPASGPPNRRGIPNRLEKRANWVAEKRFWVMSSKSVMKAPVPSPG